MRLKRKDSKGSEEVSLQRDQETIDENKKGSTLKRWKTLLSSRQYYGEKFEKLCGFRADDLTSFEKFVKLLYRATDPASLGVARALFGLCMVIDIVDERGLSDIDLKWGDPNGCHFPLIHGMEPPSLPWMIVLYAIMWMGAFGIMFGLCFKLACMSFVIPYWYIFLLDKTFWNNHTYLYGIVAILFWSTNANRYFAVDAWIAKKKNDTVPLWNYFILKFQFFALYFLAGVKKSSWEWLEGYAMTNLSRHWVFGPFKLFLTVEQTDYLIVHWFAFIFDLTVGFWMLFDGTRIPAMIFCTSFHLMNSRLFSIGMFPYTCLATMPLFCHVDWPRKVQAWFNGNSTYISEYERKYKNSTVTCEKTSEKNSNDELSLEKLNRIERTEIKKSERNAEDENESKDTKAEAAEDQCKSINLESSADQDDINNDTSNVKINHWEVSTVTKNKNNLADTLQWRESNKDKPVIAWRRVNDWKNVQPEITKKQKFVVVLLLFHVAMQFFLPYSHFITKGYNNWVPGLYGYSWDMMVYSWDTILVVIRVHDNINNEDHYVDPQAWVQGDRWTKHGDMIRQHAHCLKNNLMRQKQKALMSNRRLTDKEQWARLSSNLSIYIDVWCSLNGRFQQRIFNPNVDMLTVDWSPFKPISYLMPLLTRFNSYRYKLDDIQQHVYTWSNYTDVLFVADYPEMHLENYISTDLTNVSLTVLEGEITYTEEDSTEGLTVPKGDSIPVITGKFHKVKTISPFPACYMYTYTNQTKQLLEARGIMDPPPKVKDALPIMQELKYKVNAWSRALGHIANAFFYLVYDVPMLRRIPVI